jgi:hypothetical protein
LRQAGQEIRCECGKPVTVPPLLAMKRLEPAPPDPAAAAKPSRWGIGHRVAVIGLLIVLPSLAYGGRLLTHWPQPPYSRLDVDGYHKVIARVSPASTWAMWLDLRERGLNPLDPRDQQAYEESLLRAQIALGMAAFVAITGIVVLIIAWMLHLAQRRSGRQGP